VSEHRSPTDMLDLSGHVALVTGAGQGVGATTAHYLAAYGAAVAVNDFVLERAEAVAAEIRDSGGHAIGVQADVTAFDAVMTMTARVADELGPATVLVNNAGNAGADPRAVGHNPFWESDPADWEPFLAVNLDGVLFCCRAVIPGMIEAGRGRLITIISDAGRVGEARLEVYSAAKAGAAGLMRGLARSLGRHHITSQLGRHRLHQHAGDGGRSRQRRTDAEDAVELHDTPGRRTVRSCRHGHLSGLRRGELDHRSDLSRQRRLQCQPVNPPVRTRSVPNDTAITC